LSEGTQGQVYALRDKVNKHEKIVAKFYQSCEDAIHEEKVLKNINKMQKKTRNGYGIPSVLFSGEH
jgi:cell fate (sporulation/competence/biofilm development) regulator YmcA (YheA/YmcA/DUF963 family)